MSSVAAIEARLALPFNDPLLRVNEKHRAHYEAALGTALHAPLFRDRRLPGGLRVFSAGGTLSHRRKK